MSATQPYCLACGSKEIATEYESEIAGRQIDEVQTLRGAGSWLASYLAENAGNGTARSTTQESIAETIADLYAMARAREKQEKAEEEAAAATPEARS